MSEPMLNKANKPLFAKILQRFSAAQGSTSQLYIGDVITPVLDVSVLTQRLNSRYYSTTAVAGNSNLTPPQGKQYIVKMVHATRANAGNIDFDLIVPNAAGTAQNIYSSLAATLVNWNAPDGLLLNPGDQFGVKFGAGTSGLIMAIIVYIEVDA